MTVSKIYNEPESSVTLLKAFSIAVTTVSVLCSESLLAASNLTTSAEPLVSSRIINVSIGLIFVLFMFFLLAFLLKRMPTFQSNRNNCLNIIETLYLGSNERILLLQVGKQQILVGANSQKIETLHVLTEAIDVKPESPKKPFKEQLANMIAKKSMQGSVNP